LKQSPVIRVTEFNTFAKMKKGIVFLLGLMLILPACKSGKKADCPAYKDLHSKPGKPGKPRSNLFPKKMR
jgi:hypothetical protein